MMTTNRKRAIVTGATGGLGRALANALAEQGWDLVLVARTSDALEATARQLADLVEVQWIAGDITDPSTRARLATAAARSGAIDLVVNNAGALGPSPLPSLTEFDLDALRELFEVNVLGQLGVLQAVAPHLADDAVVVMVTSDASVQAYPGWGGYGATKAALDHLSRVLAAEHEGWRVLAVDPGDMRTRMHQRAFPGEDISDRPTPDTSVPGFMELIEGAWESGRYEARDLPGRSR